MKGGAESRSLAGEGKPVALVCEKKGLGAEKGEGGCERRFRGGLARPEDMNVIKVEQHTKEKPKEKRQTKQGFEGGDRRKKGDKKEVPRARAGPKYSEVIISGGGGGR